jgi:hypothetical protein
LNPGNKCFKMTKQKILILIPLVLIAVILTYCWTVILKTEILATWRHYAGLIFFAGIAFLFFKSINKAIVATGVFLLFATFNLLTLTTEIRISQFRIGPIYTPEFNLLSTGLFILYFSLNLDQLIDIYLDYKEAKEIKTKK